MNEPSTERRHHGPTLEKSVASILAAARPLPAGDEMIIDGLTEDEERKFFEAMRRA